MIKVLQKQLQFPKELFLFMHSPSMIFIYKSKYQVWLRGLNFKLIVKIGKLLLLGQEVLIAKKLKQDDESYMNYKIVFKKGFNETNINYRIVNYESKFLLFRSTTDNVASDREEFWKNTSGYHEHLEVNKQKEDVKKRSKWLADYINQFNPKSVLELGCGGGRNLFFIKQSNPDCKLYGVEINPEAINVAEKELGHEFKLLSNSIYDLEKIESNSIDLVFTSGVLMHISDDMIEYLKDNIKRIAKEVIIHYELHGPNHNFDFHRYPRNYQEIYKEYSNIKYEVFNKNDFRNAGTESFNHSLLLIEL